MTASEKTMSEVMALQGDIKNELSSYGSRDFIAEVENTNNAFLLSFTPKTIEEKKMLFSAMSNPDYKVGEHINEIINLKHFYVEVISLVNDETGEITEVPRVVLIDDKGKTYQAVSIGIFNSIKALVRAFGSPDTWDGAIFKVKILQISVKNGSMLTLEIQ